MTETSCHWLSSQTGRFQRQNGSLPFDIVSRFKGCRSSGKAI